MNTQPTTTSRCCYQCPWCGRWADRESQLEVRNAQAFTDPWSGKNGLLWTEDHLCPTCDTLWHFENSTL